MRGHAPVVDVLVRELAPDASVPVAALWRAYRDWCDQHDQPPICKQAQWLTRTLAQRDGIEAVRHHGGRVFYGIGLKE